MRKNIIKKAIKKLNLNLKNLTVLCEAATGIYSYTPAICALAGAKKVYAFGKKTKYAGLNKLKSIHEKIAKSFNLQNNIKFITKLNKKILEDCDILLNQGMIRPINKEKLKYMKKTSVIPLMYEAWEFRKEDVDLNYCKKKEILVLGVKESNLPIDVFSYCGKLVEKMLIKSGLKTTRINVLIIGKNKFSEVIKDYLKKSKNKIEVINKMKFYKGNISDLGVIILTNYNNKSFVSKKDILKLKSNSFSGIILQYTGGNIDYSYARKQKIKVFPDYKIQNKKMAYTFAEIGFIPVLYLIAGSIKVGEIASRMRIGGLDYKTSIDKLKKHNIVDLLN